MLQNSYKKNIRKIGISLLICLWFGFVFTASSLFVGLLYYLFRNPINALSSSPLVTNLLLTILVYALAISITFYLPKLFKPEYQELLKFNLKESGFGGLLKWRDLFLAPSGWLVYLLLTVGLGLLADKIIPWYDATQKQDLGFTSQMIVTSFDKLTVFLMLVIVAPITEELLFRGYLYGKLRKKISVISATLLVSLLFGLAHGSWNVGVDTFALSLVMCIIREETGSIYPTILMHMLKNGIALYALIKMGML